MILCGSGCSFWCFYIQEPHWFGVWECWDLEFPCLHPNSDEHFRLSTGTFSGKVLQITCNSGPGQRIGRLVARRGASGGSASSMVNSSVVVRCYVQELLGFCVETPGVDEQQALMSHWVAKVSEIVVRSCKFRINGFNIHLLTKRLKGKIE